VTSIDALLSLLDDPDPAVQESLQARLAGDGALLDQAWRTAVERGSPPKLLLEMVLRADAEGLVDAFAEVEDLESGAWLLPRLDMPRRDYRTPGSAALDAIAQRLGDQRDATAIALFLCGACGFSGAQRDFEEPANSFLPALLERRVGLPIALTVLWMLVGRRLGIECDAIALPGHVVGRWRGGFVDLYQGGQAISRTDLDARARAVGETSAQPYLAPASDRALLRRMARNLVHAYVRRSDRLRATIAHGMATA
jgi:hypothetical protein